MSSDKLNLSDVLTDEYSEEDFIEVPLSDRAFRYFFFIAAAVLAVILVRSFYLGVSRNGFYAGKATDNISNLSVEVAPRGIINDTFGNPLVENVPSFNVFVSPVDLPKDEAARNSVLDSTIATLGLNKASTTAELASASSNPADKILLKGDIDHNELISLSSQNLPGIEILPSFKMIDTTPLKFSHLIGYSSLATADDLKGNPDLTPNDLVGRAGLEEYYDNYLRGIDGKEVFLTNAAGKIQGENVVRNPVQGDTVNTYIDSGLQSYFYDSLQSDINALGRNIGAGIAMDPQNGHILALFNIPGYDPNAIASYLNAPYQPLFDRAVSGLYSPGSTIKPLVATAALTEGILDPNHQIFSPGYLYVPNPYDPSHPTKFLDWQYQGWVDMYSALARSSDVYFYEVGGGFGDQQGLGITRLKKWWQKFLLDKPTGIDMPGEESGFLPDPAWKQRTQHMAWTLGDTFNVSIGQGALTMTPIELLNYISAVANGGKLYKPEIMKNIVDQSGNVVVQSEPQILSDLSSEIGKYLPLVQKGMEDGVSKPYGTAYMLHDLPVQVAAKTGSAQVKNNAETNAFFVGYAPAQNPQIAIVILVENAKEGSLNVVPVARDVFLWYYENRLKNQSNQ